MKIIFNIFIIILLSSLIQCDQCEMRNHNFFLLPLSKEPIPSLNIISGGLSLYHYMLILKTEPKGKDNYHLVFNVTFPVNMSIELSNEIIYSFVSIKKFCLLDLTKTKGRLVNILGTISDHITKNDILSKIWIKVENVLVFKHIQDDRNIKFIMLSDFKETDRPYTQYYFMNKMYNNINQNFQVVSAVISNPKEQNNLNFECKNDLKEENVLSIGDEISILNTDGKLRENFNYNIYTEKGKTYRISEIKNFICLKYNLNGYNNNEQC